MRREIHGVKDIRIQFEQVFEFLEDCFPTLFFQPIMIFVRLIMWFSRSNRTASLRSEMDCSCEYWLPPHPSTFRFHHNVIHTARLSGIRSASRLTSAAVMLGIERVRGLQPPFSPEAVSEFPVGPPKVLIRKPDDFHAISIFQELRCSTTFSRLRCRLSSRTSTDRNRYMSACSGPFKPASALNEHGVALQSRSSQPGR